ncbi:SLC13 family permease [Roseomonas sp. HF4]|uniref:SLC13 family permease n=1 Tax=Roseomonas sp. HF4 TaxID=2562313 RepID=UPI0010C0C6E7|nr:SLC13 family permease [Roseomonas sp. HF4]
MTTAQALLLAILGGAILLFLWGRWRHDMVAVGALLACVFAGLVPAEAAFAGFGHPAVVSVAAVLILSSGLQSSGAVEALARAVLPGQGARLGRGWPAAAMLALLAAVLSAFMNNVGALALLMPLAIRLAARDGLPPGQVLMPLAFGSILGGMTTLIGTPPNLIVSGFRAAERGEGFAMFDFAPVGLAVAAAGLLFVAAFARFLVPARRASAAEAFDTGAYLTEARIGEDSKAVGLMLREVEEKLAAAEAQVVGLVRNEQRIPAPSPWRHVQAGDILVIEAEPSALATALTSLGLTLEEEVAPEPEGDEAKGKGKEEAKHKAGARALRSDEVALVELAVLPDAEIVGRSAQALRLRTRFGINLLAISRPGRHAMSRLRSTRVRAGDVLLMQGTPEAIADFASVFGCVPLAERPLVIPDRRRAVVAAGIMAGAVGAAATGLVPAAIAFVAGALAAMALRVVPVRRAYAAVDWPVIVLLGALIPVADAMATTGAADLVARGLLGLAGNGGVLVALGLVLVVTMTLSDFMNNAATAAVMCPIALRTAAEAGGAPDAFLMAVAVGSSCAFLTPIGHQNNTLILGPGGFRFGDYWRMGLPLEVIVVAVSVPLLMLVWAG